MRISGGAIAAVGALLALTSCGGEREIDVEVYRVPSPTVIELPYYTASTEPLDEVDVTREGSRVEVLLRGDGCEDAQCAETDDARLRCVRITLDRRLPRDAEVVDAADGEPVRRVERFPGPQRAVRCVAPPG